MRSVLRSGDHHGLERFNHGAHGKTLRTHRTSGATTGGRGGHDSNEAQRVTVTRMKVAGMEMPPFALLFSALASSRS